MQTLESNHTITPAISFAVGGGSREKELLGRLREMKENLVESQQDFHNLHLLMRDLERILLCDEQEIPFFKNIMSILTIDELTLFNNLYCLWETKLERRFVDFLDHNVVKHYLDYPLYARFERLIDREVRLLRGDVPKKMLFIGSGPMPITALCLQHRLGIQIDCLERFGEAVKESKKVMKKLRVENRIHVMQGYGESFNVTEYDVILIALLAKPKRAILENILASCQPQVKVICRTSENSRCVFYEPTLWRDIPTQFDVVEQARASVDDTISSVLLHKKQQ